MGPLSPPSVIEPVSRALDRTKRILFQPFDIQKWFVLGFCAWLGHLGESGFNGGNIRNRFRGDDFRGGIDSARDWVLDHLALVVILTLLLLALGFVLTWISSRGKFLFLDGVVHDRSAVAEPWREFATLGNSLFGLRLLVGVLFFVPFVGLATLAVRDVLEPGFGADGFGPDELMVVLGWMAVFAPLILAGALVSLVIEDFVVPIMWLRRVRVVSGCREALAVLSANLVVMVLYVLFKFLLAIVIGLLGCLAVCVTCCIAALPYLGTVVLLPLFVFRRSYSLEYLAQFDPDYAALAPAMTRVPPPAATPAEGEPR